MTGKQFLYFFDEDTLPVGKAFGSVRDDVCYPGHRDLPEVPRGTKDSDWLAAIGHAGRDLVVITQDKRMREKPAELLALRDNGIRMFNVNAKRDRNSWQKFVLLVTRWEKIEKLIDKAGPGPWIFQLTEAKIQELRFPTK